MPAALDLSQEKRETGEGDVPPGQAMFHPPSSLPEEVQEFLGLEEARRVLAHLNHILHTTAFHPRGPCLCLAIVMSMGSMGIIMPVFLLSIQEDGGSSIPVWLCVLIGLTFLPYIIFFFLLFYMKSARRRRLLRHVEEWNSSASGVRLSFGGGGTTPRGVTVGSQFGGTYDNFYMAMWNPNGLLFKGFLHMFVHTEERQEWCRWAATCDRPTPTRTSGRPFVPPVPLGQAPAVPYQPPAGFALVPMEQVPRDTTYWATRNITPVQ